MTGSILHLGMVLNEIAEERSRQDVKWGEQNHPDGTGPDVKLNWGADTYSGAARVCKKICQGNVPDDDNWAHILLEEIFEALEQDDVQALRVELVQSAAVLAAWIQAIDRRPWLAAPTPEDRAAAWQAMIPVPHPRANCGPLLMALPPGMACPTCGTIPDADSRAGIE